ncbi:TIGR03943 family putative permease subunit [Pseudonocardia bannensis]|uniref:TIGR03943 family protein n=1 Tax=Pseudonocardia bannensis TaxID=630973 RepID=A0A848DKJ5_9PSEU|nr:TIGR03943 family protein [Pseudonocardia bannensis]NMH93046.1 TIGR03943 family protein [Pseudonocardia bannensis]
MRRDTQHMLLVLLGGALIRIAADDTYLRYVRPSHRWWLLAAGAVMVLLAAVALARDLRGRTGPVDHDHDHGRTRSPWLLMLPVLVIALVAPPALGADAVARSGGGGAVVRNTDLYPPLPPGPLELGVGEVVNRAAWDESGSLDGREVTVTGFVVRRGAATVLARMTIACCAADARPYTIRLVGDVGDLEPDTWLRVRGTVQPGSATQANRFTPSLAVLDVQVVAEPTDPYEY